MIRSGPNEQAHLDFLHGRICLSWSKLGDLRLIEDDRKAFRNEYRRHYDRGEPDLGRGAGCLYRFVHKMNRQDLVIYPSRTDRLVRVGRVRGDYEYRPRSNHDYPHVRRVIWKKEFQRNDLPLEIKLAIRRRHALYQPRDEYLEAVQKLLPN